MISLNHNLFLTMMIIHAYADNLYVIEEVKKIGAHIACKKEEHFLFVKIE